MISFPFDSEVTFDGNGMPIYDRASNSQELREYNHLLYMDGVFPNPSTGLQVTDCSQEMSVLVLPGSVNIQGALCIEKNERMLVFEAAGNTYDRIDAVVARLNTNYEDRKIDLYVVKGLETESPIAPELTREGGIYELRLANVFIAKNTTVISAERITDTRLHTGDCGIVTCNPDKVDTTALFDQYQAALNKYLKYVQECIDGTTVGKLTSDINKLNTDLGNITLSYEDGNYYAQYGEDPSTKKLLGEIDKAQLITALANSGLGLTQESTPEQIYVALALAFSETYDIPLSGWAVSGTATGKVTSDGSTYIKGTLTSRKNLYGAYDVYVTSPTFDLSRFKSLVIRGISVRVTNNTSSGYSPKLYLVSANGTETLLYEQKNSTGENISQSISITYNVSGITGKYYLKMALHGHHGDGGGDYAGNDNIGTYIQLNKPYLSV